MRFNYVQYDNVSTELSESAKNLCKELESFIGLLGPSRPQSLAYTALEETYMWIGKAIRDKQIERGGMAEHKPERTNT